MSNLELVSTRHFSLCLRHLIQIYVQLRYLETKMQKFSSTVAFQLQDTEWQAQENIQDTEMEPRWLQTT